MWQEIQLVFRLFWQTIKPPFCTLFSYWFIIIYYLLSYKTHLATIDTDFKLHKMRYSETIEKVIPEKRCWKFESRPSFWNLPTYSSDYQTFYTKSKNHFDRRRSIIVTSRVFCNICIQVFSQKYYLRTPIVRIGGQFFSRFFHE